ncbi:MAG: hypothetical protein ACJAZ3_001934, partial [Sphingobacteriales bacterium]
LRSIPTDEGASGCIEGQVFGDPHNLLIGLPISSWFLLICKVFMQCLSLAAKYFVLSHCQSQIGK